MSCLLRLACIKLGLLHLSLSCRHLVALCAIKGRELVSHVVVLLLQTFRLTLHGLHICLERLVLLPQLGELASLTSGSKLVRALLRSGVGALQLAVLLFQAEHIQNHGVGAVEDQGEEQGETTEIHVALGVELASLDFHSVGADSERTIVFQLVTEGLCRFY